ncbi:hypothetical protein VNO80_06711 [Phaseolus coccineus]|uniref:Uncharacterized protein n=1 Tax=Phaseolus coccineus TaxID=3886 RepID=A0AAN9RIY6_PHACN
MNRKPFRNKKKGLVAGTDGDEGNRADAAGYRDRKIERGAPAPAADTVTIAAYRSRWKVACFYIYRRLPAHVIREEKAASGSLLSRATGRRLLS